MPDIKVCRQKLGNVWVSSILAGSVCAGATAFGGAQYTAPGSRLDWTGWNVKTNPPKIKQDDLDYKWSWLIWFDTFIVGFGSIGRHSTVTSADLRVKLFWPICMHACLNTEWYATPLFSKFYDSSICHCSSIKWIIMMILYPMHLSCGMMLVTIMICACIFSTIKALLLKI